MGPAGEWQQVMLAHAVEFDVAHEDDFVVIFGEYSLQVDAGIFVEPGENLGIHSGHAGWGFEESFAVGIFADRDEDFADRTLDAFVVDGGSFAMLRLHGFGSPGRWGKGYRGVGLARAIRAGRRSTCRFDYHSEFTHFQNS
jgi:hypothetical protein